jgi:hypothetical protein
MDLKKGCRGSQGSRGGALARPAVIGLAIVALATGAAFGAETDRLTVEDPASGSVMFRVTSAGNVTGASFTGDGTALSNVAHWKGNWSAATAYNKDECVFYNGSSYIGLKANTGVQPNLDQATWAVFAQQGTAGATGAQGAAGPAGPQGIQGPQGAAGSPDTPLQILSKIATQTDGAVLAVQQGPTEPATSIKLNLKDNTGSSIFNVMADGDVATGGNLSVTKNWPNNLGTNLISSFTSYDSASRFVIRRANGSSTSPKPTLAGDTLGALAFRGHDGTDFSINGLANIAAAAEENYTTTSYATRITFGTTPTGAINNIERMRITGTGNVGIGSTAPSQRLEVNGGVRVNPTTAKPACDATSRGTFWFTQGAAGIKDTTEVCAKDASEAYAWRLLW